MEINPITVDLNYFIPHKEGTIDIEFVVKYNGLTHNYLLINNFNKENFTGNYLELETVNKFYSLIIELLIKDASFKKFNQAILAEFKDNLILN